MKNNKMMIVSCGILFFVLALCTLPLLLIDANNYGNDDYGESYESAYVDITDLSYKTIVIDEKENGGSIQVTERITYDIQENKEGANWFYIELLSDDTDGLLNEYTVTSVSRILDDGSKEPWVQNEDCYDCYTWYNDNYHGDYPANSWFYCDDYGCQCVYFYTETYYSPQQLTFEIEYRMTNAVMVYNDCATIYLCPYAGSSITDLKHFHYELLVKDNDMPIKGDYDFYTYGTSQRKYNYSESEFANPGYHTFYIDLDENELIFTNNTKYLEFNLIAHGDSHDAFAEYANVNYYTDYDCYGEIMEEVNDYYNEGKPNIAGLIILLLSALSGIATVWYYRNDEWINKKHPRLKPNEDYEIYKELPGDLDPYFAGWFVKCRDEDIKENDDDRLSSILLSLVRKKYIKIGKANEEQDYSQANTLITICPIGDEPLESLCHSESKLLDLIKHNAPTGSVNLSVFQNRIDNDYEYTDCFIDGLRRCIARVGIEAGYFLNHSYDAVIKEGETLSTGFACMSLFSMILGTTILTACGIPWGYGAGLIFGICLWYCAARVEKYTKNRPILTQLGEDEYVKWKGFYQYLRSGEYLNGEVSELTYDFDKLLVYAAAFGLYEKINKQLNLKFGERIPQQNTIYHSSYYRSYHFRAHYRNFGSSMRYHSANSGGSGYSSAGRGGGGGGGGY